MKRFILILFILNLLKVEGQSIDSLRSVAYRLKDDSDRVALFYKEGLNNNTLNPQYSYDCAVEAETYAQQNDLPIYVAKASDLLGTLYYRKGDFTNALVYYKKSLALRMLVNDKEGIAVSQTHIGNVYFAMKLHALAEAAYLAAIEYFYECGDQKQIGDCLFSLGVLNTEVKNINAAENFFNAALANAKKRSDKALEARCLNKLAAVNILRKDFDAAISFGLNAVKTMGSDDNAVEVAESYLNLSGAYVGKHDFALGLSYLKNADDILDRNNYPDTRLAALMKHVEINEQGKKFEAAYQSLRNYNTLKDSLDEMNALAKTGNNFIERKIVSEAEINSKTENFPYLLLATLCLIALGCIVFLFRFKR